MKYDLNRLKDAIDSQIPEVHPDIELLHQALQRTKRRREPQTARTFTYAAAGVLLLIMIGSLLAPAMQVRPDDTGDRPFALSQGMTAFPQTSAAPRQENPTADATVWEEDMENYSAYSPMFGKSMFPDEAEFGEVVIRKIQQGYEDVFAFYDKQTDERIFEGENLWFYGQAFAYFPVTDTALVGNGEGMALIARDGTQLTGYVYSHFEYLGGGIAIAAENGEDETVPSPMYLVSTKDGKRLSQEYAIIGTVTMSGDRKFLTGYFDYDLAYDFDLMHMDGSVIARLCEVSGIYFDEWLCVMLPGETDCCLMDMNGNLQLDGMRFDRMMGERNGMAIVRTDGGWAVIRQTGEWVFNPGEYLYIEMGPEDTFLVTDHSGERLQLNAQGENVTSPGMRVRWAVDEAEAALIDWLNRFGKLGRAALIGLAGYLLMRLIRSRAEGEFTRMLATEAGWAAYIAAILTLSYRHAVGNTQLWPTVTSTEGAFAAALWFALAAYCALASVIAVFPKMRRPGRAFLAGAALMLVPWIWKMIFCDMSVRDWRTASNLIFFSLPVLALVLFRARFVRRYMDWCASLDAQSEYGRWWRLAWYALLLLALTDFGAGSWLSGQEMVSLAHQAEPQRGIVQTYDEDWIDAVNGLYGEYVLAGRSEELLEERTEETGWDTAQAVRWMDRHGIDQFRADMLLSVRLKASLKLKRPAETGLYLNGGSDSVPMIGFWNEEGLTSGGVWLLPPNGTLPEITAGIYVRQRQSEWITSQQLWSIDIGPVAGEPGTSAPSLPS